MIALQINPNFERETKNIPILTTFERWVKLTSLRDVDNVIPYETEQDLTVFLLMWS